MIKQEKKLKIPKHLIEIINTTKFNEEEILEYEKMYLRLCEKKTNIMTVENFQKFMKMMCMKTNSHLVERIFNLMDKDGNKKLVFKEFMQYFNTLLRGTQEEKSEFCFLMICEGNPLNKGKKKIDKFFKKQDVVELLELVHESQGESVEEEDIVILEQVSGNLMKLMNVGEDDAVTLDKFKDSTSKNADLLNIFDMMSEGLKDLISYHGENRFTKILRVLNVVHDKFKPVDYSFSKFQIGIDKLDANWDGQSSPPLRSRYGHNTYSGKSSLKSKLKYRKFKTGVGADGMKPKDSVVEKIILKMDTINAFKMAIMNKMNKPDESSDLNSLTNESPKTKFEREKNKTKFQLKLEQEGSGKIVKKSVRRFKKFINKTRKEETKLKLVNQSVENIKEDTDDNIFKEIYKIDETVIEDSKESLQIPPLVRYQEKNVKLKNFTEANNIKISSPSIRSCNRFIFKDGMLQGRFPSEKSNSKENIQLNIPGLDDASRICLESQDDSIVSKFKKAVLKFSTRWLNKNSSSQIDNIEAFIRGVFSNTKS